MLIVEDNLYVADVLIDECEMALGAEVMAVETGHMALQFLARSPPQLQSSYARLKATMEASKRIVDVARKTTRASAEARARRQMNQFGHC